MFILNEIFRLFSYVAYWCKMLTIFAIWAVTLYLIAGLFKGDINLPTPFTLNTTTAQTSSGSISHYSDLPIKISMYDPALAGINCDSDCSTMASGQKVVDWYGKSLACPSEFPLWTEFYIEGIGTRICLDRGGAIINNGEFIWVDLLLHESDFNTVPPFGTLVYEWGIVTDTPQEYSQPVQNIVQQTSSCPIQKPYEYGGITQDLHGNKALDYKAGEGIDVLSPISGTVIQNEITVSDNTTIVIENDCYMVKMYHGDWSAQVGTSVEIGDVIGTESNKGYTFTNEGETYCGTGSSCGHHTHLEVFDKVSNTYIDPRDRYED